MLKQPSFIGEIILESLIDPSVLNGWQKYLIHSRTATVENFEPTFWHIQRYRLPLTEVKKLLPLLEHNFHKNAWYIHFYSESTNEMFVVLPGKTFHLTKYPDASWAEMIAYGEQVGVDKRWTANIPVDLAD